MGSYVKLKASDGNAFEAYVAEPSGKPRGVVVVIQEIFGVNSHIRSVTDDYAKNGYWATAAALFDRVEPHVELAYGSDDAAMGMKIATQVGMEKALLDVAATIDHARTAAPGSKVGVVGFCWGGSLAWLSATLLNPAAAVGYYGGQIARYATETLRCPVMLHFGEKDAHIGPEEIAKIREAHPDLPIFLYDAGHGFNCDQRKSYEPLSAALARERTLEFLHKHVG